MKKTDFSTSLTIFERCCLAILAIGVTTAILMLIGKNFLGDAVIALLYLLPIAYSTTRWGQAPGICAAVSAALAFDFFFIPPFYTFNIGSLEGWLVLAIFLSVAILIVGRIQYGLAQAQEREREAIFMYEVSSGLSGIRTQEAVARYLAEKLRQVTLAALVQVAVEIEGSTRLVSVPEGMRMDGKPDRVLPVQSAWGMAGELHIWEGDKPLPKEDNRLLQAFIIQGALALERARLDESRLKV